jgi:cytochrome c peroxidase
MADGKQGTCATCHRPGINHSIDIGTTNLPVSKESPELPLFRITCDASAPPHPQLGRTFLTQDPGRALITGKCADVGSILMQQFRGLSARAPYFANGSARDLTELVDLFDHRFKIGLTDQEKQDLVNFLSIL